MIMVQRYAHFLATGLHIWSPVRSRDGRERGGRWQMEVCKVRGPIVTVRCRCECRPMSMRVSSDVDVSIVRCASPKTICNGVERMGGRAKTCWLPCSMGCDGWQRNCRKNNSRTCGCGCSGISFWDESIRYGGLSWRCRRQ